MAQKSRNIVTRFHPIHGENIVLYEDGKVADRFSSFAHSVAFSEKPLEPGEIFLVEIEGTERGWSGHMRLGLTLIDPITINNKIPQYSMPNLIKRGNTWIFGITKSHTIWDSFEGEGIPSREKKLVCDGVNVYTSRGVIPLNALKANTIDPRQVILPTDVGSRIGLMYMPQAGSTKAEMHVIVNGEDQGVCGKDIPYKAGPLYAVVDVYGTTKRVRIVQLYGGMSANKFTISPFALQEYFDCKRELYSNKEISTLQSACRDAILQYTKRNAIELLPLPRVLKDYLLYKSQ